MKNVQFALRQINWDWLVFPAGLILSAFVVYMLIPPFVFDDVRIWEALFTAMLSALVWTIFHFAEPAQWSRNWLKVKYIGIPIVWLLMVVGLAFFFKHFNTEYDKESYRLVDTARVILQPWR
jgi:hypothetical protein